MGESEYHFRLCIVPDKISFFLSVCSHYPVLSPDTDALVRDLDKPQDPPTPWRPKSGASGRLAHTLGE